ncbi:hypothetical protein MMC34_004126 [Xylographa carneopallida]|nr:hypothetical protein [Xylographa carneopallida]
MQYSKIAFLAALAAPLVAAQDLSGLPSCALTPAINSLSSTGCALTDVACICNDSSFLHSLQTTVEAVCDQADLAKALQFAKTLCLSAGVTLVIPTPSAQGPTTAAAASTTPAPVTTSPVASTTLTTTVPVVSTVTSAAPTSAITSSATPTSVVIVSVISDGQPQVPTNATTLASATITPFKGAAATNKAQFAGVAMLVGAVGAAFAL